MASWFASHRIPFPFPVPLTPLVLLLAACGGSGSDASPPQAAPEIRSFVVEPGSVAAGGEARLSWEVTGADTVRIDPEPGRVAPSGARILRPLADTQYTLDARNAAGQSTLGVSVATRTYDWTPVADLLASQVPAAVEGYVFQLAVDGVTVFSTAGGNLQTDSEVLIASASKALTSIALLTLVRDGLLALDQPVASILGEVIDWPPDKAAITTRMLLNHTSGMAADEPCLDDVLIDLRNCVQTIARLPLRFEPGTRFSYGANSYQVAGLVAEVLTGQSFTDLFAARVAQPLDLDSLRFVGLNPRLAGGAISNAADYLRFSQMVLARGRVGETQFLPEALVSTLRTSQIGDVLRMELPPGANFEGYALGWWISPQARLGSLSQGPEISVPGAFGTIPWLDDDRRYTAILLLRDEVQTGIELWNSLRPLILEQLAGGQG